MPVQKTVVRWFVVWVLLPTKHGKRLLRAQCPDEFTGGLFSVRFAALYFGRGRVRGSFCSKNYG